jgi:hypothetical protein
MAQTNPNLAESRKLLNLKDFEMHIETDLPSMTPQASELEYTVHILNAKGHNDFINKCMVTMNKVLINIHGEAIQAYYNETPAGERFFYWESVLPSHAYSIRLYEYRRDQAIVHVALHV